MALNLTPWPTAAGALTAARTALRSALGLRNYDPASPLPQITDARLDTAAATASALIERESPGAPQAVRTEAMIRLCGYLLQSDSRDGNLFVTGAELGPQKLNYNPPSPQAAFRLCGAKALLSPWKIRSAGLVE